ncbi:MAG TPA: DUF692 family protein [Terriglobales bacterium]|nr:DUF692 family protein [Terriglobales bacterium]
MPAIPHDRLSIGTFYNPHLAEFTLAHAHLIDHLAMADPPAADDQFFPDIQSHFPLLLHDYLGQLSDPLSAFALKRARALQDRYRSPWVAEHFQCLHTQDHSRSLDYVFPPLYTEEFLKRFCENAVILREAVNAPLVMENIPGFFSVRRAQMSEAEFLRRFFEQTGCGFLIDVPHIWLAAHYRGIDARDYLADFPLDRVVEIHVAGVEFDRDLEGPWIAPTPPGEQILSLASWVAERAPKLRAVTVDVFSPAVTAAQLEDSMRRTRARFAIASAAAS